VPTDGSSRVETLETALDVTLAHILAQTHDPRASWFALTEGDRLFSVGDPADTLYVLRSGRLGVFTPREGQPPLFVGIIKPGTPVGEMSSPCPEMPSSTWPATIQNLWQMWPRS